MLAPMEEEIIRKLYPKFLDKEHNYDVSEMHRLLLSHGYDGKLLDQIKNVLDDVECLQIAFDQASRMAFPEKE